MSYTSDRMAAICCPETTGFSASFHHSTIVSG